MKDIFSELYNKVLGFFRQTEKKEEETAKDVACNRLKVVLMQDRTNLTPELMNRMRKELVELLSKYVDMYLPINNNNYTELIKRTKINEKKI